MARIFLSVILAFIICFTHSASSLSLDWKELKDSHFVVYYLGDNKTFAKKVLGEAEKNYTRIAHYLGYTRYSNFWTWDNRVKIYIYADKPSYVKATSMPEWSEGMADYLKKKIASYVLSEDFLDSILPHEIGHLMFRDFVGFAGEVPLWLDEGVAQWVEVKKRDDVRRAIKDYEKKGTLLSLKDIMNMDMAKITNKDGVRIRYTLNEGGKPIIMLLSGDNLVKLYYVQSASIVGFLVERYGTRDFSNFCRRLRDGKSMEDALRISYPRNITSLDELEKGWLSYIRRE